METENTWQTDKAANVAVLEGMTAYFKEIGARVGLYSTGYQWGQIAGTVKSTSPLAGLPSWLAGARIGGRGQGELRPPRAHPEQPRLDDAVHLRGP